MTHLKTIYDNNDTDTDTDSLLISNMDKTKKNLRLYNLNIIYVYTFLVIILILQAITLNYFIIIGNTLEQFDNININEINIYVNKTKTILDYVCVNLIKC